MRLYPDARISVSLVVSLSLFAILFPSLGMPQSSVEGVDATDVIKSIQEQIDYVASQPLGDPPLLLTHIDVDLTMVGEQTTGGGLTFKVVFFEVGGNVTVIKAITTTTHLKLLPSKVQLFAATPPPIPFDKFLIETLRQIKAGLHATSFIPESIDLSVEFSVKKEAGGAGGIKGFSLLGLAEIGGGIDAAALRQRIHKITLHFTRK